MNYSEDGKWPLARGMNKKVIGSMKDELGEKIMMQFFVFRPKTCSHWTDNNNAKRARGTKKCVIKKEYLTLIIIKAVFLRMKSY